MHRLAEREQKLPKEWILNSAMNRYQLNYKRNVGAVSEAIRKCGPRSVAEWEDYYYSNIRPRSHIDELGRKLYVKITEVISSEVESVTEEECIAYMRELVISRTYDGYTTEIQTIHGQLAGMINAKIEPAPDEWDRGFNVDFFIKVSSSYIGLQIKPVSDIAMIPQIFKERGIQQSTHEEFTKKFGGKVFYVFSIKTGGSKQIQNLEVVEQIRAEIARLSR
jgi:hypothetical protein